jgi:hypothetical protein
MAHFAKLGSNSKVIQVLTLNNGDMLNADGVEDESVGQQYLERHNNWPAQMWIQTSYNTSGGTHKDGGTPLRGNYAGIGYTWDEDNNIFYGKKPFASWVLDIPTASWKSPIGDAPDDLTDEEKEARTHYVWNEGTGAWDKTTPAA